MRPSVISTFRLMLDLMLYLIRKIMTLAFGIIFTLMLIVSPQIGLKLDLVLGFRLKLI